jgi:hypothetical protein
MPAIQIRDVPPEARDALAERARQKNQSLSMYLRDVILREAGFARNAALVDEISSWPEDDSGYTVEDIISTRDAERER